MRVILTHLSLFLGLQLSFIFALVLSPPAILSAFPLRTEYGRCTKEGGWVEDERASLQGGATCEKKVEIGKSIGLMTPIHELGMEQMSKRSKRTLFFGIVSLRMCANKNKIPCRNSFFAGDIVLLTFCSLL